MRSADGLLKLTMTPSVGGLPRWHLNRHLDGCGEAGSGRCHAGPGSVLRGCKAPNRTIPNVRAILVVNPRGDLEFEELSARLAADGADTPAALERALRTRYPKAHVRERVLSSEPIVTWYVYREGTWVPNA